MAVVRIIYIGISLLFLTGCAHKGFKSESFSESLVNNESVTVYPVLIDYKKKGLVFNVKNPNELEGIHQLMDAMLLKNTKEKTPNKIELKNELSDSTRYVKNLKRLFKLLKNRDFMDLKEEKDELFSEFKEEEGLVVVSYFKGSSKTRVRSLLSSLVDIVLMIPTFTTNMAVKTNSFYTIAIIDVSQKKVVYFDYCKDDIDFKNPADLQFQSEVVWWKI